MVAMLSGEVSAGWFAETSPGSLEYFVKLIQSVGETQLETNELRRQDNCARQ
jgi:hypothetical protein